MYGGGAAGGMQQSMLFASDSPGFGYSQGRNRTFRTPSSAGRPTSDRRLSGTGSAMSGGRATYGLQRYTSGGRTGGGYDSRFGGTPGGGAMGMGAGVEPGSNYATPRSRGGGRGPMLGSAPRSSNNRREPASRRMPATWSSGSMLIPAAGAGNGSGLRQRARGSVTPPQVEGPPTRSYDDEDDDLDDDDDDAMLMDTSMGGRTTPGAGLGRVGGDLDRSTLDDDLDRGQLDGFGGRLSPSDVLGSGEDACWVTAFGFRPGMSDDVLRHFQKYGTIISQKVSSSNWLHIQYETRDQANKAIGANGRIHDGYMLGVVWRSEADVNANQAGQDSAAGHHRLAQRRTPKTTFASTHLDSESIFKPRPRRKNVCTRMCEYLFKSSW